MKTLLLAALPFIAPVSAQPLYIGTGDKGIFFSEFDPEAGTLTPPRLAAQYPRPGFLALHPEKTVLYSVGGDNTIAAFRILPDSSLENLGSAPTLGTNPCHLVIDHTGRTVAAANYGDGSLITIRLDENGKPTETASFLEIEGSGPDQKRQRAAHTHGVYFDKANRHLFAPDLGADKTLVYRFDPATSIITPHDPAALPATPGAGPRHMTFSPDEKHAYIINELSNTITAATFDPGAGTLGVIQEISTLPPGFKAPNTTSEIEIHPGGNFAYAANRGHNTIAVFRRDPQSGKLTPLQHTTCGGFIPRHFTIHPSGKWLLCANQKSNTISVLPLDPTTGLLGTPKSIVEVPAPMCLLFP